MTHEEIGKAIESGDFSVIEHFFETKPEPYFRDFIGRFYTDKHCKTKILDSILQAAMLGHLKGVSRLFEVSELSIDVFLIEYLQEAAKNGELEKINNLLKIPELSQCYILSVLPYAAERGDMQIVNRLLTAKKALTSFNPLNQALNVAAEKGHLPVVERLLNIPFVPYTQSKHYNCLAYMNAILQGRHEIIRSFLNFPEFVQYEAANNYPGLERAAAAGDVELIKLHLTKIDKSELAKAASIALIAAAKHGHVEALERLLTIPEVKSVVAANQNAVLSAALQHEQYAVIDYLLKEEDVIEGLPKDAFVLLNKAITDERLVTIDRLLKEPSVLKALISDRNHILLQNAITRWNHHYSRYEIRNDEKKLRTIYSLMAAYDRVGLRLPNIPIDSYRSVSPDRTLELLTSKFFENEAVDLLHQAIRCDHLLAVETLLTMPKYSGSLGKALLYVISTPHTGLAKYLLTKPDAINSALILLVSDRRRDPLNKENDLVTLLKAGADPNIRIVGRDPEVVLMEQGKEAWRFKEIHPEAGFPLIIYAAAKGLGEVIKRLIQDPTVDLNEVYGKTNALYWAEKNNHQNIVKMLNEAMEQRERKSVEAFAAQHFSSGDNGDSAEYKAVAEQKAFVEEARIEAQQQTEALRDPQCQAKSHTGMLVHYSTLLSDEARIMDPNANANTKSSSGISSKMVTWA